MTKYSNKKFNLSFLPTTYICVFEKLYKLNQYKYFVLFFENLEYITSFNS